MRNHSEMTKRWRALIWLGMALGVVVVSVGSYFTWIHLCNREARYYGVSLTHRLRDTVVKIDKATDRAFSDNYYHRLNHKPLLKMDLDHDPVMQDYSRDLYQVVRNPIGGLAMYTECGAPEISHCYYDLLYDSPNKHTLSGYNPKSRPWYLLAQIHPEWVVFTFLSTKKSVPGFPKIPTLGFAKRIVRGIPESDEDGIWIVVVSHTASKAAAKDGLSPSALLAMLFHDQHSPLDSLEISLPGYLLFSDMQLKPDFSMPVHCSAITDGVGIRYKASVQCAVGGEVIHYTFAKRYDHPFLLLGLCVIGGGMLCGAWRFWRHVDLLQQLQAEMQLSSRIETKLVHDLKKGIMTQLNKIFDPQPDLQQHKDTLMLLNKYVNLLGNSMRREREETWIPFTLESCRHYLQWILGEVAIRQTEGAADGAFLEIWYDTEVKIRLGAPWPELSVPEMGFYRILKNIIENYNTHGFGGLRIVMKTEGSGVLISAKNAVAKTHSGGTQLGLAIIQQLLEDNFARAYVRQVKRLNEHELNIFLG